MPRFFVQREQIEDRKIRITGEDAHHISRSLRMAVGEALTVCDMQRTEYECRLAAFTEKEVWAEILSEKPSDTEPFYRAVLYQALPKGDKLDAVIQKAVECGVSEIVPFESERCVVRIKPDQEEKKTERRQRIANSAAKQAGRGILPAVLPSVRFSEMLEAAGQADVRLFCYEGDGTTPLGACLKAAGAFSKELREKPGGMTVAIVIGSEGGFSQKEAEMARARGMQLCGLGKRILRTETASSFVLSCLVYALELSDLS